MSELIVGLDMSLTATGVCDDKYGATVYKTKLRGVARLIDIRGHVMHRAGLNPAPLVVLEGYSMGGQRGSAGVGQMLGELGGVIRVALVEARVAYVEVPPAVLKKFATSKGNAGKPDMLAAAIRAGYDGPNDDNCVDAWWLRILGLYAAGRVWGSTHTAYRDEAVAKIDWSAA